MRGRAKEEYVGFCHLEIQLQSAARETKVRVGLWEKQLQDPSNVKCLKQTDGINTEDNRWPSGQEL